jgi:hypothetical protein
MEQPSNDWDNNKTDKNEHMLKMLMKENDNLKKVMRDKISGNEMFSSLLTILELQRDRINLLERGKKYVWINIV